MAVGITGCLQQCSVSLPTPSEGQDLVLLLETGPTASEVGTTVLGELAREVFAQGGVVPGRL